VTEFNLTFLGAGNTTNTTVVFTKLKLKISVSYPFSQRRRMLLNFVAKNDFVSTVHFFGLPFANLDSELGNGTDMYFTLET
jgi:hypothetical protein